MDGRIKFSELLALMRDMLLEDNVLPNRTYEAKKMLCSSGMSLIRYMLVQTIVYFFEANMHR